MGRFLQSFVLQILIGTQKEKAKNQNKTKQNKTKKFKRKSMFAASC